MYLRISAGITLALLILVAIGLFAPGGAQPIAWQPKPAPAMTGIWGPNDRLDAAITEQRGISGPDTVIQGPDGYRYSAIAGGRIVRWLQSGPLEDYITLEGRPVGMNFGPDGALYLADEENGRIWKISSDRNATLLTDRIEGRHFNLLNDVWIARDGRVFFTESTSRWPLAENRRALMEHGGDGSVFVWHPDGKVKQVLADLNFANGVTLSAEEDYLLVAETGAYQITRLWLKGPKAGERDVLVDNLPGFTGDLSIAADGSSYWCSLFSPRSGLLDALAPYPLARRLLARLPLSLLPEAEPFPFVFRFDESGQVLESLQDATDSTLPSFSSVVQYGDALLLGTPGGVGVIDSDKAFHVPLH